MKNPLSILMRTGQSKGMDLTGKLLMLSQTGMVRLNFYNHMLVSFTKPHWQANFIFKDEGRGLEVVIKSDNSPTPEMAVDNLIAKMESVKALPSGV